MKTHTAATELFDDIRRVCQSPSRAEDSASREPFSVDCPFAAGGVRSIAVVRWKWQAKVVIRPKRAEEQRQRGSDRTTAA